MKNRFDFQGMMIAALLVLVWCASSVAQTISPVSSKFTGRGKGDLTLTNNSLVPVNVSLEAVNFQLGTDRKIVRSQLDPHTHVKFSKSGVRIGPKDSVHVYFDASADTYPAWFMIYATFMKADPKPGIKVAMQLGHPVYMYQRESIPKADVSVEKVTFDPATRKLRVVAENRGGKLARPQISFPQLHDNQVRMGLYPMFPNATTTTDIDFSTTDYLKNFVPAQAIVEFDHFKISTPVTVEASASVQTTAPASSPTLAAPYTSSPSTPVSHPLW